MARGNLYELDGQNTQPERSRGDAPARLGMIPPPFNLSPILIDQVIESSEECLIWLRHDVSAIEKAAKRSGVKRSQGSELARGGDPSDGHGRTG
eukprot:6199722-Pleurochrysis_carterae.AAC.6